VAIVSAKPQTTRNRIAGVVEVEAVKGIHPAAQIVFVDTPGVHKPGSHLDRRMLQEVYEALETRDVVLVLMDATRRVQLEAVETVGEANTSGAEAPALPAGLNVGVENPTYRSRDGDEVSRSPKARDLGHPGLVTQTPKKRVFDCGRCCDLRSG